MLEHGYGYNSCNGNKNWKFMNKLFVVGHGCQENVGIDGVTKAHKRWHHNIDIISLDSYVFKRNLVIRCDVCVVLWEDEMELIKLLEVLCFFIDGHD